MQSYHHSSTNRRITAYKDLAGERGQWCGHPRWQSSRGIKIRGKITVINKKNDFL
jgi:hypothetical protein